MSDPVGRGPATGALRTVGIAAVFLGVAVLAAGAFVFSYPGIHAFALQAGISARLARLYPLLADATLVVVLAAVLSLRGAGLPSRLLAWCVLLLLLGAAAGADAWHAAGRSVPAKPASVTAAVLPWVLVLLAFGLLLAMLRHARLRRAAGIATATDAGLSILGADLIPHQPADARADNSGAGNSASGEQEPAGQQEPSDEVVFYRVRSSPAPPAAD